MVTDVSVQSEGHSDGPSVPDRSSDAPQSHPRRITLRGNFRWTFVGNVVNGASQWGMLAVLARLGSPETLGRFVLGLAIAAPIISLSMLQLRNVQVTDSRGDFSFADYFATRIVWTIVGMAVIIGVALLGDYDRQTVWVVVLVGLTKCVDSVSDIVRGLFQRQERMDLSAISLMLKGPAALVAMAAAMWWTGSLITAVIALAVVWCLTFLLYDVRLARWLPSREAGGESVDGAKPLRFAGKLSWRLTWIALPLGIVMALISLQSSIPRYVLQGVFGSEQLAFFAAVVYPMTAGMMVVTAMGQAASPRLARYFVENPPAFRSLLWKFLGLSVGLGAAFVLGVFLFGGFALGILYGDEYAKFDSEFTVVAVAGAIQFVGSAFGYALTAARRFRLQVALTVISCGVMAVAAFLLVPGRGVMGASLALVATAASACLGFGISVYWAYSQRVRHGATEIAGGGGRIA